MNKTMNYIISDLHCHILPSVDDGAKDIETASSLLKMEAEQNVRQICFTPHFYSNIIDIDNFIKNREKSYKSILQLLFSMDIDCKLGAEVHMSPDMIDMDLSSLCFKDTNYLLLEWPNMNFPVWGRELFDNLVSQGITPIFAHIERVQYFFSDLDSLEEYIEAGALCQMNASVFLDKRIQKQALKLVKSNYVHVISSDTHNCEHRPPKLDQAYRVIENKLGDSCCKMLAENGNNIFNGRDIDKRNIETKKHFFFKK